MSNQTSTAADITPRQAYDKGHRCRAELLDDALDRFERKYCRHADGQVMCELEHAYINGFEDAAHGERRHATRCRFGVAHAGGHTYCRDGQDDGVSSYADLEARARAEATAYAERVR